MTTIRRLLATTAALPLALLAPTSAAADTPAATTYHGVFTGRVFDRCSMETPTGEHVSGTWNIIKRGDTDATVSINIFVDGKHHVSFGGPVLQTTDVRDSTVAVKLETQAGTLTISLTGDALTYKIPGYSLLGLTCDPSGGVNYTGLLGR